MIAKPKKTRILSLSIIDKAMDAIEATADIDDQLISNVQKYNLQPVLDYYEEIVEELSYQYNRRKADLVKINDLYITRERLYRILNPTIYLNAYTEKRANDAIYINANVGFIDDKGKVKNVVVFMGKSEETNLAKLKVKIEKDQTFIEEAKKKVIEKLVGKIKIPPFSKTKNDKRRNYNLDVKPELNRMSEMTLGNLKLLVDKFDKNGNALEPGAEKKSRVIIMHVKSLLKNLDRSQDDLSID